MQSVLSGGPMAPDVQRLPPMYPCPAPDRTPMYPCPAPDRLPMYPCPAPAGCRQATAFSQYPIPGFQQSSGIQQTQLYPAFQQLRLPVTCPTSGSGSSNSVRDFSQPLFVDTSVEYEIPKEAHPPRDSTPLLMVHPQYYEYLRHKRLLGASCTCQLCNFYGQRTRSLQSVNCADTRTGQAPAKSCGGDLRSGHTQQRPGCVDARLCQAGDLRSGHVSGWGSAGGGIQVPHWRYMYPQPARAAVQPGQQQASLQPSQNQHCAHLNREKRPPKRTSDVRQAAPRLDQPAKCCERQRDAVAEAPAARGLRAGCQEVSVGATASALKRPHPGERCDSDSGYSSVETETDWWRCLGGGASPETSGDGTAGAAGRRPAEEPAGSQQPASKRRRTEPSQCPAAAAVGTVQFSVSQPLYPAPI